MFIIWPLEKFKSDYETIESIGQGQYGEVFSVLEKKRNFIAAAKFQKCKRAAEKLRVRDEVDLLKDLDHDNVIKFISAYEDQDQFVQVLEHLRYA